ncbi:MAG TPA: hypothetical protein VGF59_01065, partial [Bryobacteraceae bacterium]
RIDGNDRLRRMYYEEAPPQYRRMRLGQAVAASACVPGLFDPLVLERLYPEFAAKLVDGGVYDNQGGASLLAEDCTVLLISDASGQTGLDRRPAGERIAVSLRSNNVLMARNRQEQYQLASTLKDAGLLRGIAYVHLKKDLDAQPVDWVDCPDPSTPEQPALLTTYGIRKDVQAALACIRTDLDGFSDAESDALMLSGYRMMQEEFQSCISGFPVDGAAPANWRFRQVEGLASAMHSSPELVSFKKTLTVARNTAFKPYRISTPLKLAAWLAIAAVLAGLWLLGVDVRGVSVSLAWLLAVVIALAVAAFVAKLVLRRVLHNPNPLWQIGLAIPMLILGGPLTWIWTRFFDPIYLRSGPRYRK